MLKKNILSLQPKSTRLPRKGMLILFKNDTYRGVEQLVARQAHNLEVACSSLASATSKQGVLQVYYQKSNRLLGQNIGS